MKEILVVIGILFAIYLSVSIAWACLGGDKPRDFQDK